MDGSTLILPPGTPKTSSAGRSGGGLDALKTETALAIDTDNARGGSSQNRQASGDTQLMNKIIENIRETHGVDFNPDQIKTLPPAMQGQIWDALRKFAPDIAKNFDEESSDKDNKDDKEKLAFLAELFGGAGLTAEALAAAERHHRRLRLGHYGREALIGGRIGRAARAERRAALVERAEEAKRMGHTEEALALERQASRLKKLEKVARIGHIIKRVGKMSLYGFIIKRLAEGGIIYELAPEGKREQWAKDVAFRSPFSAAARADFAQGKYLAAVVDEGKGFFDDMKGLVSFAAQFVADPKKTIAQGKKDLTDACDGIQALVELYKENPELAKKEGCQVLSDAGLFGDVIKENRDTATQLAHDSLMGNGAARQDEKQLAFAAARKPGLIDTLLNQAPEAEQVINAARPSSRAGKSPDAEDNMG